MLQDITQIDADAIVTAAHEHLAYVGFSELITMVHNEAGPQLMEECRGSGRHKKGDAFITKGYKLPCKNVIHAVVPDRQETYEEQKVILANCYRRALHVAVEAGARVVALPDLSSQRAEIAQAEAAEIAAEEIVHFLLGPLGSKIDLVVVCLLRKILKDEYCAVLEKSIRGGITFQPEQG